MTRRFTVACAWLLWGSSSWALDADVQFHIQARQAQVAPLCAALLARTTALQPEAAYQKALCLLYGVQMQANPAAAMAELRKLAQAGMTEAQLALGDMLAQGGTEQQLEAVEWYDKAANAGDLRAALRKSRLAGRLQAAEEAAKAAASKLNSPDSGDTLSDAMNDAVITQQPGYHCHFYGLGKKVCHGGMD